MTLAVVGACVLPRHPTVCSQDPLRMHCAETHARIADMRMQPHREHRQVRAEDPSAARVLSARVFLLGL